ncbi:hypothetical protein H2200_013288 [Cladophialophora chaetospira]|uniref:Oxidoreductase n=1 Tax=Cladophialophora chaetospira TaxID=386627 RepID=A0AA38WW09_9EURO|nr:hypothetical protein H2200_013288 [Cladophialophora chaetospira]
MLKPKIRIAIAGSSGVIGQRHLQHVLEEQDAVLAAIMLAISDCDSNVPGVAKQLNVPFFKDTLDFIEAYKAGSLGADAIILATPTHTHVPLTKQLAGLGLAVLIEKPVATSATEGRDLLRACQDDEGGVYMVGHHRRHHGQVRAVKHAVDSGSLGTVVGVNGVWTWRKSESYFQVPWRQRVGAGGVILTNAIHEIDMLQYWLGDISEVYALEGVKTRPFPVDSTVQITLKFASGPIGSFFLSDATTSGTSWEAATGENPDFPVTGEPTLSLFGTRGSISIPSLTRFHYDNRPDAEKNWNFPLEMDDTARQLLDTVPPFARQLQHFIAATRREVEPNCSISEALSAVFVVEAIFKSLESHSPVAVDRL